LGKEEKQWDEAVKLILGFPLFYDIPRFRFSIVGKTADIGDTKMDQQSKRWYRKAQVATRYDSCDRTIDRAVEDGRLPPPKFPLGNKVPYWDGDELDAHDRNLAARMPRKSEAPAQTAQPTTA
jgi:hypothetical protein